MSENKIDYISFDVSLYSIVEKGAEEAFMKDLKDYIVNKYNPESSWDVDIDVLEHTGECTHGQSN